MAEEVIEARNKTITYYQNFNFNSFPLIVSKIEVSNTGSYSPPEQLLKKLKPYSDIAITDNSCTKMILSF